MEDVSGRKTGEPTRPTYALRNSGRGLKRARAKKVRCRKKLPRTPPLGNSYGHVLSTRTKLEGEFVITSGIKLLSCFLSCFLCKRANIRVEDACSVPAVPSPPHGKPRGAV
eukprot:7609317-Pyramimonas_sp.AAC.1